MAQKSFVLAGFLIATAIGLSTLAFVSQSKQSPKSAVSTNDEVFPSVWDVPEYSSSIKVNDSNYLDDARINFGTCVPGKASTTRGFGSDHAIIKGIEDNICVIYLGGETENPGWDGRLSIQCRVPTKKGVQEFSSLRFDRLPEYATMCSELVSKNL
jgi:hypothetical protein